MGFEVIREGMSESESFWLRFKSIKRKSKKQSSKQSHFSNQAAEIRPSRLDSGKSESSVRQLVSISREGELVPVSSSDPQSVKKKKPPGFDAAEIKVKSHDAVDIISVKSRESEVCSEELAPKQISEEEEFSARKLDRRSWVRIAKAFRFITAPDLHPNSRNGAKVSQDSNRGGDANDTPVIDQLKAQEIRPNKEVEDSIPGPLEQTSKSSRIYAAVDSKSRKLLKSIDFHKKLSSRAGAPSSYFKRREFKSADRLSSSSSYPEFSTPDMTVPGNSNKPNSQPKKLNTSEKRKKTIEAESGEGEGYNTAISLAVLIIIMGCLVVFSGRFVAVVCTSFWWYLLPRLLKKARAVTGAVASEIPNN